MFYFIVRMRLLPCLHTTLNNLWERFVAKPTIMYLFGYHIDCNIFFMYKVSNNIANFKKNFPFFIKNSINYVFIPIYLANTQLFCTFAIVND